MTDHLSMLRAYLAENKALFEAFFVTSPENCAYLSGFRGSFGFLLITDSDSILFTDGRYVEQAKIQAPGWKVMQLMRPFESAVSEEIKHLKINRLGFEANHLTYSEYLNWAVHIPNIEWIPTTDSISSLRQRKSQNEINLIKHAVHIADQAFSYILTIIKPGISEREVAAELEYFMRRNGAERAAFETIVASGRRGSLPHGRASEKNIEVGDLVTLDFGAHFEGYNSDISRTISIGAPNEQQRETYNLVLEAQMAAIAAIKPGEKCSYIDSIPRSIFNRAGQIEFYRHSLGHSLGREIHEYPFFAPTDHTILDTGMVLTVEPGLYYPHWGGVRIEDDVLVTIKGVEVLTHSPKELIIL